MLTLSVPSGQERSLTGSDIKRMSWPEYTFLYEVRDVQIADSLSTKLPSKRLLSSFCNGCVQCIVPMPSYHFGSCAD